MAKDLDQANVDDDGRLAADPVVTVRDWQAEQERREFIPASEIAQEIALYLPNPGQYQQLIISAHVDEDGSILLGAINGQSYRLRWDIVE